jgi:S-adenosylmethionine synthetase
VANDFLFTSESVSEGHPDKVADQISDAILDAIFKQDPRSRVAAETLTNTGLVVLAGEITTNAHVDYIQVARDTIKRIGYDNTEYGIDYKGCAVMVCYDKQSNDIAQGVDHARRPPEHRRRRPGPDVRLRLRRDARADARAHLLRPPPGGAPGPAAQGRPPALPAARRQEPGDDALRGRQAPQHRHRGALHPARARPERDAQEDEGEFTEAIIEEIIKPVLPKEWLQEHAYLINPTGRFVIGGPQGDCGLTGRKIIVDTYGGACPHGGGAFSGKDPSKVDRSAAYAARYVAKNIVAAGLARQCQIQVAYAIGVAKPMNITVYTEGTGVISDEKLSPLVAEHFDLRPKGIIQMLDLLRPIYEKTAAYGHFGREEPEFSWERTDKVGTPTVQRHCRHHHAVVARSHRSLCGRQPGLKIIAGGRHALPAEVQQVGVFQRLVKLAPNAHGQHRLPTCSRRSAAKLGVERQDQHVTPGRRLAQRAAHAGERVVQHGVDLAAQGIPLGHGADVHGALEIVVGQLRRIFGVPGLQRLGRGGRQRRLCHDPGPQHAGGK